MGNICSIFHLRFKRLIKIIPNARKAQLVDYIILGWQKSTYTLKGSDQKWFMKPYTQIVEETGIAKSTLERYIKELNDEGFIERRQALYCRTTEEGRFEVKKGTYIYITSKLLNLLQTNPTETTTSETNNNWQSNNELPKQQAGKESPSSTKFNKNEGNEPLILRESYIRDLYPSLLNNIILKKLTSSVDKPKLQCLSQQFETIQKLLYSEIKEEIPDEVKRLVLGTFFNLTYTHQKHFSLPKQVVAEYMFALLNIEYYLPNVTCFKHRNNILSKMVRTNNWKTPKGFYKHFYLGQDFKDQQELREQRLAQQNEQNLNPVFETKDKSALIDKRLIQLEEQMLEKSTLIDALTMSIYTQSSEEEIVLIRERIQSAKSELEHLWQQQSLLEQELEISMCA